MQFRLRKVTKISELILGNQFIAFNKSMESFLRKDDAMSGIPLIAIKTRPGAVDVRIGKTISTITQETLDKYMNVYAVNVVCSENLKFDKEVFNLRRKIRKLEKKNDVLNKIIKKNNIELIQHKVYPEKEKSKKEKKAMTNISQFSDNIFGYNAMVTTKTNYTDKVEVIIHVTPSINRHNDTSVKIDKSITVSGEAIKHKDDEFNINLGKQLAYSRAINKFMEIIAKGEY